MAGYPVALTLAGVSLLFAAFGELAGVFDSAFISLIPNRIFGILVNKNLFAVPLFVFMGSMLEKSRIAEDLLKNMELILFMICQVLERTYKIILKYIFSISR